MIYATITYKVYRGKRIKPVREIESWLITEDEEQLREVLKNGEERWGEYFGTPYTVHGEAEWEENGVTLIIA